MKFILGALLYILNFFTIIVDIFIKKLLYIICFIGVCSIIYTVNLKFNHNLPVNETLFLIVNYLLFFIVLPAVLIKYCPIWLSKIHIILWTKYNSEFFNFERFTKESRTEDSENYTDEKDSECHEQLNENELKIRWFAGVSNMDELRRRYRELMKIYHPDNLAGNEAVTQEILHEYEELQLEYDFSANSINK